MTTSHRPFRSTSCRFSAAVFFASLAALFQSLCAPALAGSAQWVYDAADRLIQVIDASGNSAAYSYDAAGNLLSTTILTPPTAAVVGFSNTSAAVGSTITIFGSGFSTTPSANTVSFGTTSATVLSATANALTVQVPTGATTSLVTVTDSNGTAVSSNNFTVTGSPNAPTISSFTPQLADRGASVTISGSHFGSTASDNRVFFGGQPATITAASSSSLTVTVPDSASPGHITVATNLGTAVSSQDFFVPPTGSSAANVASTTRVTIGGGSSTIAVGTAGQFGMAIFDGSVGQLVSVAVSTNTFPSSCSLGILSPYLEGPGVSTSFDSRTFCTGQTNITLPVTGTYALTVVPAPADTGSLTFSLSTPPVSSGIIQIGGSAVTATTSVATQQSRLTFESTQLDQVVSIGVTGASYPNGCAQQILRVVGPLPGNPVVFTGDLCSTQSAVLGPVGTYTLEVIPYGTDTGAVTLSLTSVAAVTGSITIGGSPVTVTTSTPGQQAVLTFTTSTANEGITIQPSSDSFPSWCNFQKIIVSGPSPSASVLSTTDLCTTHAAVLPTVGTYSLTVVPKPTDTGGVTLQLASATPVSSSITIGGSPVTLSTTLPAQQAQFTFTTTSMNQTISIQPSACSLSDCWDAMLLVSGPSPVNTYIDTIYLSEAARSETLHNLGTYTITLIPYDTDYGSITLQLQNAPTVTGAVSIGGSPVTLTTTVPAQKAQWSFTTTTANQKLSFQTSGASYPDGCAAGIVQLTDPTHPNNSLASFSVCPGSWASVHTVSTPGPYLLTFIPSSTYTDVGSLTVQLQNAPDVTGSLSINGSAVTVSTTVPAQQADVSFTSTTTNQSVRVAVSSNTYPSWCYAGFLIVDGPDPSNGYMGSTNFCSGTTSLTLGAVGTYHIRVLPNNTDTGSITMQVLSP